MPLKTTDALEEPEAKEAKESEEAEEVTPKEEPKEEKDEATKPVTLEDVVLQGSLQAPQEETKEQVLQETKEQVLQPEEPPSLSVLRQEAKRARNERYRHKMFG